jgi:hypothetical protein
MIEDPDVKEVWKGEFRVESLFSCIETYEMPSTRNGVYPSAVRSCHQPAYVCSAKGMERKLQSPPFCGWYVLLVSHRMFGNEWIRFSHSLAFHHHLVQEFSRYEIMKGEPHPDKWTLNILSKVICE